MAGLRSLKIGILAQSFIDWGGGIDFLRTQVRALAMTPRDDARIYLYLPLEPLELSISKRFRRLARMVWRSVRSGRLVTEAARAQRAKDVLRAFSEFKGRVRFRYFSGGRPGLERAVARDGTEVLLPVSGWLRWSFEGAWVGYIFDFQHKHFPDLFSSEDSIARDAAFEFVLREAPVVIVNAAAVRNDVALYYPGREAKVVALPFAPSLHPRSYDRDIAATRDLYGVPPRYFMISNQFWLHKDHATAFRAWRLFLNADERHSDVVLVCTGEMSDYRSTSNVDGLRCLVDELGIGATVRLLGHIDKLDQLALVRGAIAMVQPTTCEGGPGGGAICDSVSVGTRGIVSDIPVNLEMNEPLNCYFPVGDHVALAARMVETINVEFEPPAREELFRRSEHRLERLRQAHLHAVAIALRERATR